MELIDFSQFVSRRAAQTSARNNMTVPDAPVFDRWADLHAVRPVQEATVAPTSDGEATDFWYDLQFRLAYPTHRLRRH
jgi:hypothetical protein